MHCWREVLSWMNSPMRASLCVLRAKSSRRALHSGDLDQLHAIAPGCLGGINGLIRGVDQTDQFLRLRQLRKQRDADADRCARVELRRDGRQRLRDFFTQAFGMRAHLVRIATAESDDEFFAAVAPEQV